MLHRIRGFLGGALRIQLTLTKMTSSASDGGAISIKSDRLTGRVSASVLSFRREVTAPSVSTAMKHVLRAFKASSNTNLHY